MWLRFGSRLVANYYALGPAVLCAGFFRIWHAGVLIFDVGCGGLAVDCCFASGLAVLGGSTVARAWGRSGCWLLLSFRSASRVGWVSVLNVAVAPVLAVFSMAVAVARVWRYFALPLGVGRVKLLLRHTS